MEKMAPSNGPIGPPVYLLNCPVTYPLGASIDTDPSPLPSSISISHLLKIATNPSPLSHL